MGGSKKMSSQDSSNVIKCLKLPILILIRAKNLYIESLIAGASHMRYGNAMGCPIPVISTLPRRSNCEGDLIKVAATKRKIIDAELLRSKGVGKSVNPNKIVTIRRIGEEFDYAGKNA